jgi:hypothetical protein
MPSGAFNEVSTSLFASYTLVKAAQDGPPPSKAAHVFFF